MLFDLGKAYTSTSLVEILTLDIFDDFIGSDHKTCKDFFFLLLHELICLTFIGLAHFSFVMGYLINTLISPFRKMQKRLNNVGENRYTTYLYDFALVYV